MADVHSVANAGSALHSAELGLKAPGTSRPDTSLAYAVLPGMVARGHGMEALCLYLCLARAALLDLLVELDLPTPHGRALRKVGGQNAWSVSDTVLFIASWVAGWHAESLGQRFGRSAGSAWAKARQLGLPSRDRRRVFRPASAGDAPSPHVLRNPGPGSRPPAPLDGRASSGSAPGRLPLAAVTDGPAQSGTAVASNPQHRASVTDDLFGPTPVGTPPRIRAKRLETPWTRERDIELGQRWWARQHYKAIARDMGISPSAVQSRRFRLGLPTLHTSDLFIFQREELVEHFDPSVVADHIVAAGYVERKCNRYAEAGTQFWFWSRRIDGQFTSEEWRRLADRQRSRPSAARLVHRAPTLSYASQPF